jgi:hypothetical protein
MSASAGDEGGQIDLNKAVTNTTLNTGVSIDVYQDRLRFFETGGSSRGFYLDMTTGGASVGSPLASAALTINAQTASYTLVLADQNKLVEMNVASANNLTVPLNSSVAYPVGTQINILQTGAGQTTVVATGGVTINGTPGLKIRTQWSSATLIKRATDTWVLVGDISA